MSKKEPEQGEPGLVTPANPPASQDAPAPIVLPKTAKPKKSNPAADLLRGKVMRDARVKDEQRAKREAETVIFLKCPRVKGHMAAFLTEDPRGLIRPGMWHALYKAVDDQWTERYIPCQECFYEGEQVHWDAYVRPVSRGPQGINFVLSEKRELAIGTCPRSELNAKTEAWETAKAEKAGS